MVAIGLIFTYYFGLFTRHHDVPELTVAYEARPRAPRGVQQGPSQPSRKYYRYTGSLQRLLW